MSSMREIRFRAKSNGHWFYFGLSEVGDLGIPLIKLSDNKWVMATTGDEFTNLSEYTGLKDKNGVEIYEGDIVLYPFEYQTAKQVVEFHKTIGGYGFIDTGDSLTKSLSINCEVIGNIYEHGDLLK